MQNVKQGSSEYQRLKSFGLTRPGNQTQDNRLRGRRSNHSSVLPGSFRGIGAIYFKIGNRRDILNTALLTRISARTQSLKWGSKHIHHIQGRNQDFAKGVLKNGKNCDVILMTYLGDLI